MITRRSALTAIGGALAAHAAAGPPLRVAVAGLEHGHVRGFFRSVAGRIGIEIVGVVEANAALRARYLESSNVPVTLGFASLDEMFARAKPEAVLGYTNTFDHLALIEKCAAHKTAVMVEKPLAVSNAHAARIKKAADASGIPVLVNYETTWYASNAAARKLVEEGAIGEVRKIVVQDGHQGPKEINVPDEFFNWLTDPKKNGAGALFDFGCYGANLITWLMNNQRPQSVLALTQTIKPGIYRSVDDEATILLEYPKAQGIVQGSWNWPFSRKDMEVYGRTGYVHTIGATGLRVRLPKQEEELRKATPIPAPDDDSLRYLTAVVRDGLKPAGLSSLENNLIVTEILDAARQSAHTRQTVRLP